MLKDTQIHILADSDEQEVVQQVQVHHFSWSFIYELIYNISCFLVVNVEYNAHVNWMSDVTGSTVLQENHIKYHLVELYNWWNSQVA
jgi:hypothetical protein